ncbi:MAG: GNAT family N-acetyltransferase [Candidatus Fournierella pullistercoris]|uniref:GNAT family N-acetyltransferase n=1 Tax=Candidatus Allofournierella pullistercoris TaxID=2838597 RepID=A0A948T1G9_9FIRM|nr:GNAT family N-acetyltransferase [Candidatus Fournierella pullistercoris]
MIETVTTPQQKRRFLRGLSHPAVHGIHAELGAYFKAYHNLSQGPWMFLTSGEGQAPLSIGLRGTTALVSGTACPEELASCLSFLGVKQLRTTGLVPAGWVAAEPVVRMVLTQPVVPPKPWRVELEQQPSLFQVSQLLQNSDSFRGESPQAVEEFYAQTCRMVNQGLAQVWAVQHQGYLVATAGAYSIWPCRAYLSGVETLPSWRGMGLASWLVGYLSQDLQKKGLEVELVCRPKHEGFYQRLGFERREKTAFWVPDTTI